MRQPDDAELTLWMDTAENCVRQLKSDIEAQDFYVAANVATSSVPFSHLTKAFCVYESVLTLCRAGFGSEAYALSRLNLEMYLTLRWITNYDQVNRAEDYALFVAKRKEYLAKMIEKYQPGTPQAAEAVNHVQNLYKTYADKYKRFSFWCNKVNSLKELAQEQEVLYGRRVSTTLRQVLTKFSEFFVCWIRVPSFPREISLQDRLATTIGDSVDPQHSRFCRFLGAFRFSKVARCCFICIVPVR